MTARHYGLSACALAILLLAMSLVGGTRAFGAASPHVMDVVVRLPAVSGRPAAGFFLAHGTANADALVGVASPKAQRIELHSVKEENGVMRMRAEPSFALPAKGELKFAPGGSHLMIFGLAHDVKPGDRLPMVFSFKSGARVAVNADVVATGAAPKTEATHQH